MRGTIGSGKGIGAGAGEHESNVDDAHAPTGDADVRDAAPTDDINKGATTSINHLKGKHQLIFDRCALACHRI